MGLDWAGDLTDAGVIVGSAGGRACVLIPEDADGDGAPDTWFVDDGQGGNALIIPLGDGGATESWAQRANSDGQIVGAANDGGTASGDEIYRALFWEDPTPINLGAPVSGWQGIATDINALGQIVVRTGDPEDGWYNFVLDPFDAQGNGWIDLGVPPIFGRQYVSPRMNDDGWIVLPTDYNTSPAPDLIIPLDADDDGAADTWFADDGEGGNALGVSLPPLRADTGVSAWGINNDGTIAGRSFGGNSGVRAVVWQMDADGLFTVTALPDPKGVGGVTGSVATGINDAGYVWGWVYAGGNPFTIDIPSCIWHDGKVVLVRDLAPELEGVWGQISSVNNSGAIVLNMSPGELLIVPNEP